jgi:hypothetical protein
VRPEDKKQKIERAKRYPFANPASSYIFVNGHPLELVEFDADSLVECQVRIDDKVLPFKAYLQSIGIDSFPDLPERTPVLAYGSNASPEQLNRKFPSLTTDVIIPVIKAQLFDFDVVYAPLLAGYGSIPATLQHSPGTIVNVFVTYLTHFQLERMHETEGVGRGYCFGKLANIKLILANNVSLSEVTSYLAMSGCLMVSDSCISLAAVTAKNRVFPQMTQMEMLAFVRDRLARNQNLDAFILENVENPEINQYRTELLKQIGRKFAYESFEILMG